MTKDVIHSLDISMICSVLAILDGFEQWPVCVVLTDRISPSKCVLGDRIAIG